MKRNIHLYEHLEQIYHYSKTISSKSYYDSLKNHDHMETSILLFSSNTRNRNCNLKKKTLGKGTFIKKVHLPCNISSEKGRDF
jgi:hypothetical protein